MSKNIVLACFMKIGDRVKMNWTDTSGGWDTSKRKQNGTCGVVIGFHEYFQFHDISDGPRKKYGKYRNNGGPFVLWDDGDSEHVSPHDICFEDPYYVHPEVNSEYCKLFQTEGFVEDLPELPLMVGNLVSCKTDEDNNSWFNQPMVIHGIDYQFVGKKCNDNITDYPIYRITPADGSGGTTNVRFEQFTDFDSTTGNYWAWLNDKNRLSFLDLKEEVAFYQSLGLVYQIKNPETDNYGWTIEQAAAAVKAGVADVVRVNNGFFGGAPYPTVHKVDESLGDLAERCRNAFVHE